ncbi:hypothetical protein [Phenylobacterium sp. J367]|uniref:hypothetical protein n=1 Tax=Phenylobacterium sp. J367 TaxID=2898435 RepID=UPI0021517A4E|nr:hypothetical protein [Phenylobacterium sp. J367]MCR5879950.1 hypothetical protein [Phenylobacterium sp. J367]
MENIRARDARTVVLPAAATLLLVAAGPAAAQSFGDRYWIEAQVFRPNIDTTVDLTRTGGTRGTEIDFENDLGLKDTDNLPALRGGVRFGRFFVAGEVYSLKRDASKTLTRDVVFDGVTYPTNVNLSSEFDSQIYRASLGYMFFQRDTWEMGATAGLFATDFAISTSGQGQIGSNPVRQTETRARDFIAPLPTVGVIGSAQLAPRWVVSGRADYMSLSLGDYGGGIANIEGDVAYKVTDNIALGAGYRFVDYDLEVDKSDWEADVEYGFNGPFLFVRAGF